MCIQHNTENIKLTAGEIAELFNTYINNKASICVLSYFNAKVKDSDIKYILTRSYQVSVKLTEWIYNIFKAVEHPIPKAFNDEDVNVNAQKLYTDTFMLTYVRYMARFALVNYSEARASATRSDIRDLFNDAISSTLELINVADNLLLGKGIYFKAPYIPIPNNIEFIKKQSYLGGMFQEKRTLNASEINRLYLNFQRNVLGEALLTGFIQTTRNREIKEYLIRGKKLAKNHMDLAASYLEEGGLAIPAVMTQEVTESTESVFSDKLMLFHVIALDGIGFSTNGISLSRIMRKDINISISRLMAEIALFAEDGFKLMIDNQWIEGIPEAKDMREIMEIK